MNSTQQNNPLHGVTLETILNELVNCYGWDSLGQQINVRCFIYQPSMVTSLKFLRRTPWAREKVESLYLAMLRQKPVPRVLAVATDIAQAPLAQEHSKAEPAATAAIMTYEEHLDEVTTLLVELYDMVDDAAIQRVMKAQADDFFSGHDDNPAICTLDRAHQDAKTLFKKYPPS